MGGRQRFAELVRQLRVGEVGSARSPGGAQARAKTHQGSGDTDVDAARSQARSKLVGLGMSGGGFRASLYHLGTLSVLAEVDALRRIDFISTVSGGSIIGLHFFLRLRQLLQEKKDVEITREDYIEVVADVTRTFMELVSSKDSYWRSYKNPLANFYLRMDGGRRGRIEQILRIIERDLYSQFQTPEEAACTQTCSLERLRIQPPDERETYIPYRVNQRRRAKVPVLLINATCLNSGHRFVFASDAIPPPENMLPDDARYWSYTRPGGWLGEISDPNFSSVPTLPPLKYRHIDPDGKRKLTMATAAAASASVPVIFSPVSLEGLYRTRPSYRVVLVDGSVSDNTGLETLRDCGATTVILSDGGVEVAEDQRIKYRRNPVASTGRAIDILTVQAQQDRLLAAARSKRAREAPVIHISLAFDRRFSRKTVQAKLNRNILQHDKTIMIKHTDIEAAVARMAQSPASIAPRASANNGSASSAAAANQSGGGSVSKGTRRRLFAGSAAKGNLSQAQPVGGRALGAAEELNDAEAEGEDPPPQRQWSAALPPATPMPTPLPSLSRTHDAPFQSSGHWDTPSMRASSSTSSLANQEEEEAPLPDVHKRVIRLMGRVRTHLDLFSEVECSCIMVVAYLEAAIQLRAETSRRAVHDLYSGPNGGSGDSGEPELPWSAMLLLRLTSDRGHQWGFLRLVPFLASTTWDDMEAKRGQQRLRAPHWLRQLSAMLPLVELPGAGDDDDDADEREDEAAFSRTRGTAEALALDAAAPESSGANPGLEKDTTFRWLVQDLDAQLDAAATVFPRMLSLLPRWITQLVGLLIVLGVLSTLCVLIYVLVDNFWEYRERECFQDYREEVWYGGLVQIGFVDAYPFLFFVGDGSCRDYLLVDGFLYETHENFEELEATLQFGFESDTDYLLEGLGSNGSDAWLKPIPTVLCRVIAGISDACTEPAEDINPVFNIPRAYDGVVMPTTEVLYRNKDCSGEELELFLSGTRGLETCQGFVDALQTYECATWDNTRISNLAIFFITVFGLLFILFTRLGGALLFGLFVQPLGALFDTWVNTPLMRRRGSLRPYTQFLDEHHKELAREASHKQGPLAMARRRGEALQQILVAGMPFKWREQDQDADGSLEEDSGGLDYRVASGHY